MKTINLQVGALLHFNSGFKTDGDPKFGSKHFDLDGSCVWLGNSKMLGISHTIADQALAHWVFLPGQGIFEVGSMVNATSRRDHDQNGDHLVVFNLKTSSEPLVRGIDFEYLSRTSYKNLKVGGFGTWAVGQRRHVLRGGIYREFVISHAGRINNLDVVWNAQPNAGLMASRDNSGGPIVAMSCVGGLGEGKLVGIIREEITDQTVGSRIAFNREQALRAEVGSRGLSGIQPFGVEVRERELAGRASLKFAVPEGATKARVTLSATAHRRLQIGLAGRAWGERELEELAQNYSNSGRFLYRELSSPQRELHVGVTTVAGHEEAAPVEIQICVLFEAPVQ